MFILIINEFAIDCIIIADALLTTDFDLLIFLVNS